MNAFSAIETKAKQVLAEVEQGGEKVVKVVTVIGGGCALVGKLMTQGKAIAPEVKTQLTDLIEKGEVVATAITGAAASSGANWTADAAAVAAVEAFVPVMISTLKVLKAEAEEFLPEIENAFSGTSTTVNALGVAAVPLS